MVQSTVYRFLQKVPPWRVYNQTEKKNLINQVIAQITCALINSDLYSFLPSARNILPLTLPMVG